MSTVLDVGSSKLTALCGSNVMGKLVISAQCSCPYAGFLDGEFLDFDDLAQGLEKVLSSLQLGLAEPIKKITVGVPAEFCYSVTKKVNVTFAVRTKITDEIMQEVFEKAVENLDGYFAINAETVFAVIDDGQKVISPLGAKAIKLSVLVNTIYAKKSFVATFNELLLSQGVWSVNYISTPLAIVQTFFGDLAQSVCIVDIGYLSSSVCIAKGRGIEKMFSFSKGGAHVEVALMDAFALTLKEAMALKKNLVLSLDENTLEFYEATNLGKTRKILAKSANAVAEEALSELAYIISECIKKSNAPDFGSIYLTGGGITQISGIKAYLADQLGLEVNFLSYTNFGISNPYHSSSIALLLSQISS